MTPDPARWHFDAHTRDELAELAGEATVVVPLGSTEQHGHHLPVAVDTIVVTTLAHRAASRAAEQALVLVTPTVPFGFAEHHLPFGGTVSLSASTYLDVLTDIGRSLGRQEFRRLVFLNGHGGNETAMKLALDRLAFERPLGMHLAGASYWELASDVLAELELEAGTVPGHAGHFETSLLLAIAPELVALDKRPTDPLGPMPIGVPETSGARVHHPRVWEESDGRSDDASRASTELGTRVLDEMVEKIVDFVVAFHRSG